jgi:hypothetical protein
MTTYHTLYPGDPRHDALMTYGRAFTGIARPKGYRRQRRLGSCFYNAITAALNGRGMYVEGITYAYGDLSDVPIHHAWITIDGENAIDQTWTDANRHEYFGIAFPIEVVARAALSNRNLWGMLNESSVLANLPTLLKGARSKARA